MPSAIPQSRHINGRIEYTVQRPCSLRYGQTASAPVITLRPAALWMRDRSAGDVGTGPQNSRQSPLHSSRGSSR